ncbi:MAG: hypothetical protein ACE5MI_00385 [Acidimicrobiia bacterium]
MDDLAVRFADLLDNIAAWIRSLTVERVEKATRIVSLGIVTATLAVVALILIAIGVFRAVASQIGVIATYFLFGGLFVLLGALAWAVRKRAPKSTDV